MIGSRIAKSRVGGIAALLSVAVATIGIIALAYWLATDSGDSRPSESGQGGGGVPFRPLQELFESLPLPAGTVVDQAPVANGDAVLAGYWLEEAPEAVVSFYTLELPKQAWTLESSEGVVSDPKDDGTRSTSSTLVFVREDTRLTVSIAANTKDPSRGQARMAITAQPR